MKLPAQPGCVTDAAGAAMVAAIFPVTVGATGFLGTIGQEEFYFLFMDNIFEMTGDGGNIIGFVEITPIIEEFHLF